MIAFIFLALVASPAIAAANTKLGADPVQVAIYDEYLCPDCRDFFKDQFEPTWTELQDIMDVQFNAYGWATDVPLGEGYEFDCQHGKDECVGNMIIGCAEAHSPAESLDFIVCMMTKSVLFASAEQNGKKCAEEVGIDFEIINTCANTVEGQKLLHNAGLEFSALEPEPIGVPWIIIDGVPTPEAETDFKTKICNAYQGVKPPACP